VESCLVFCYKLLPSVGYGNIDSLVLIYSIDLVWECDRKRWSRTSDIEVIPCIIKLFAQCSRHCAHGLTRQPLLCDRAGDSYCFTVIK